ncbi:MAG: hypothetical protein WCP35_15465, partial [Verrucomicrobiota bacterium]
DSVESLQAAMEANGWEKLGGSKYRHIETGAIISDTRPPNVMHDAEGNVWPFDVVVHDTGKNPNSLKSSPASNDSQPDLSTAANAPDARDKLGDVKAGTMNALGAYKALTAKRERIGSLSGAEENQLLQAEKALGQKLAFDMEAVKGEADSQPVTPHAKSDRPEWGNRGIGGQGDMMLPGGHEKSAQMTLLSSAQQHEKQHEKTGHEGKKQAHSAHGNGHEQAQGKSLEDAKTFLEGSVGGSRSTLPWQRKPRREAERAALIGWAERNRKLFTENPLGGFKDKRVTRHGEHDVAYDEATGRWWKATYGNTAGITADFHYDDMPPFEVRGVSATEATPLEYLQRMSLLNSEFGGTVELEGVWMDHGEPRLVVSQADVHGRPSETEEIAGLMEKKGYVEAPAITIGKPNTLSFINPKKNIALFDAHKGNFRTDSDGDVHVIDAVLSRVTPAEAEFLQSPSNHRGAITLRSSSQQHAPEIDAQAAARQALDRMPPVFHEVFNAITKGDSMQEVKERFKLSDK